MTGPQSGPPPQPPPPPAAVEAKVIASTAASLVIAAVVAVLNAVQTDHTLLGGLPVLVQTVLLVLVPPLLTFAAGYQAPHTRRDP
jgi:hypothetical protein